LDEFEFLAVFVSIVIGIGVTHILRGLARIIYNREQHKFSTLHFLWSINALVAMLLNWWVFFLWADHAVWSFDKYLLLIMWAISLYMLAVVLYPPDIRRDVSYTKLFWRNRQWILGTFVAVVLLDIAQTAVRGQLFQPVYYLPYVLHYVVLSVVGIFVASRRYQIFFAWYLLASLFIWSFGIRRLLGA